MTPVRTSRAIKPEESSGPSGNCAFSPRSALVAAASGPDPESDRRSHASGERQKNSNTCTFHDRISDLESVRIMGPVPISVARLPDVTLPVWRQPVSMIENFVLAAKNEDGGRGLDTVIARSMNNKKSEPHHLPARVRFVVLTRDLRRKKFWPSEIDGANLFLLLLLSFQLSFFLWSTLGFFLLFPSAFIFASLVTHICFSVI
jgi:hypothetical protein